MRAKNKSVCPLLFLFLFFFLPHNPKSFPPNSLLFLSRLLPQFFFLISDLKSVPTVSRLYISLRRCNFTSYLNFIIFFVKEMAHSCISSTTSASAAFRFNSLFFSASSTPNSDLHQQQLLFPFQPLLRTSNKNLVSTQTKAVYGNSRIWSIRDDLQVPSSAYFPSYATQGGQGPPPMVQERFHSVISQLFQHRIIRCGGAVDDDMANIIVAQLLYLDAIDPTKDIVMYVNSPGGSVTAGMAIFDTMRHIRPDVSTVCVGLAASMGAFLLSAGTKGKRYSLPNSRIMIHQPLGGAQGGQTDIDIQANEMLHHKANLNGYLSYHTGQSLEKINQDTDRDFFMSAKEAKEYGLIDGVILNPLKAHQPLPATAEQ